MEIKKLKSEQLDEILALYKDIKNNTYTIWDKDYPSKELVLYDIERNGLWGVFDKNTLVGVCFCGERCEDGEEDFTWKDTFNKRGTFARIGISPAYQNQGIATMLVKFVLEDLQKQGFDGVRILVGTKNENAQKLYKKFGFYNCGETHRYGHNYYLYELRIQENLNFIR